MASETGTGTQSGDEGQNGSGPAQGDVKGDVEVDVEGHMEIDAEIDAEIDVEVDFEVVVVGAGFAGLYLIHRLRELGISAQGLETADDVGGTWYWNRYPGARCDIQSVDYSFSFDRELDETWEWSEKYATQPEILRYANHVADRFDLRRSFRFGTSVVAASWNESASTWSVETDQGDAITCRHYVMATGCLSLPKAPELDGLESFAGDVYFTSRWPHDGVDLSGKRVGVIGTGSSGVQSIPIMARQASALTVFQRTPNFSVPAHNGDIPTDKLETIRSGRAQYREDAKWSRGGIPGETTEDSGLSLSPAEREARMEAAWDAGELFAILGIFSDQMINEDSNAIVAEFIRGKIRSIVDDPETAETLCPADHPFGTKRPCLDTGYYETFNLPTVDLVDLRKTPIVSANERGIETAEQSFEFDAIVFATGFDAMTGALVSVDITGRDGVKLKDKWADGPLAYLGLTVEGFPNFFTITGPGSPSVLSNMMVSIEQHVDWVSACIADMRDDGLVDIEATGTAEAGWVQHVNDAANITLYPKANSWYMGANVAGKARVFLPYVAGVDFYRKACDAVRDQGYLGFSRSDGSGRTECNDGLIRRLQPDVQFMLDFMAELELPPLESMSPAEARAFSEAASGQRPPGPDVGEIVDGELPGADGPLAYRLYRPAGNGPHPVTVYFHGGGWVLGSQESDDPMCRDLCDRSGSIIISVNYRHAPEHRFPAAPMDAIAAVDWVAANLHSLGGIDGTIAVAGWSAGANLAAVVCQQAKLNGGPEIAGQLLVTPVTDCDFSRPSYTENAEGFVLTKALMDWFWDHYIDEADRENPLVSPLRTEDLSGLPPALIVTGEFDPLRDEGAAYAAALGDAGVDVHHLPARGHIHTSLTAVDVVISGAPLRAEMAAALQKFLSASVSPV